MITVHTLDRLGRTVRDTLNLIYDLNERGVGIRNLADPIRIDSADPDDPMAGLAVIMLTLFAQMERTHAVERAVHARAVATAKGRQVGRPSVVTDAALAHAVQFRDGGATMSKIVSKTGLTRSTLYRHLPPRPTQQVTAATSPSADEDSAATESARMNGAPDPLVRPSCGYQPTSRKDLIPHHHDGATVWLHLDEDRVRERRHCQRCQPHDQIISSRSPAVVAATASSSPEPPATSQPNPVLTWLRRHHWQTVPELICDNHN